MNKLCTCSDDYTKFLISVQDSLIERAYFQPSVFSKQYAVKIAVNVYYQNKMEENHLKL